jgi:copper chaperone CopZ
MRFTQILITAVLLTGIAMAKETTTQIKVSGMTCGACAVSVKAALTRTKGVKSADVNTAKGLATVVYDDNQVSERQLVDEINRTGFKAEPSKEKK